MEIEGLIIRQTPFQDSDMMVTILSKEMSSFVLTIMCNIILKI